MNNNSLCVKWQYTKEAAQLLQMTNIVLAAFTAAQTRLKLSEYFNVLGKRALYYDTDSVFYVSDLKKGDNELPIGFMLGELTDELAEKGPGTFIELFVSGGPKFYAYKFSKLNGECGYICKVKGIRLDFANSQTINFESIRQMVLGEKGPIELRRATISRTAFYDVLTQMEKKSCKRIW